MLKLTQVFLLHTRVHLYLQGVALCCRACDQAAAGADKQVLRNAATHHGDRSYTGASWDLNNNSICYCRSRPAARTHTLLLGEPKNMNDFA